MFTITDATSGKCILCSSKAKKDKAVFVVQGPIKGNLCAEHLLILVQQQKAKE